MHPSSQKQTLQRNVRDLAIEWEDTPSLAHLVSPRAEADVIDQGWEATRPLDLDDELVPAVWVRDRVPGLEVNEINEPEIFRHYFIETPRQLASAAGV